MNAISPGPHVRRENKEHRTFSSSKLKYLEADLTVPGGCTFYAGFSREVLGIFVPTYMLYQEGTPIALRLTFFGGKQKSATGIVEWIRELSPFSSDAEPGIGVRLTDADSALHALIESYTKDFPPLFFEGGRLETDERALGEASAPKALCTEDIDASFAPMYADTTVCTGTASEPADFSGLIRDVSAYLKQQGTKLSLFDTHRFFTNENERIHVFAVELSGEYQQFHGGFSKDDDDAGEKVFVSTEIVRPVGTRLNLGISLPDGRMLHASGEVKWVRKYNPLVSRHLAPPGLGISLDDVSEKNRTLARNLIGTGGRVLYCEESLFPAPDDKNTALYQRMN
jgi:Tfp pilus assembly protein PilZ